MKHPANLRGREPRDTQPLCSQLLWRWEQWELRTVGWCHRAQRDAVGKVRLAQGIGEQDWQCRRSRCCCCQTWALT